jgi:DNA-binding transcriptional MerR regulator
VAIYSIRDLEKLSGIRAHTLRIWEQRYGIIDPKRTATNIRYYTDEDLKSLLNIALLNKNGYKISKIARMTTEEVAAKVATISEENFENETQLDALTISMIEMDESKFEKIVATNIEQYGFERTMLDVINPFLEKLGLLWLTGSINPAQEHFISALIRRKIMVAIDREPIVTDPQVPKFLLYLPENESHELILLFMHSLIKARGLRAVYLGQNIPFEDLRSVHEIHRPQYLFTMFSESFYKVPLQTYLNKLSQTYHDCTLLVTGYQVAALSLDLPANVRVLDSLDEAIELLDGIRQ